MKDEDRELVKLKPFAPDHDWAIPMGAQVERVAEMRRDERDHDE